ncbi:nucleotide exchange factor GrpE [Caminicella sporogenes]|uniref:nucleotide exchange factor GrpE n=1 Tax=Caminicella sporogenes TaxID=166485 RepID=UPI00253FC638|nr:nucleotide exchange factor GrpE [Caminicella sporogenes]WIF94809.1 nucleotide exchange factor GrpE [Caminicella sporogenes]
MSLDKEKDILENLDEENKENQNNSIDSETDERETEKVKNEDGNCIGCQEREDNKDESEEIEKYKKEIEEYKNKYLRITADFQNFKRRVEKEKSDLYKYGSEKIIVDILPILDNLERALQSAEDAEDNKGLRDGIEMVYKQFKDVLQKHGLEEIDCLGKEFDPNCHHAIMQEECEDKQSNSIIEVFQKGYKLNSKVIRPSLVKVAK